MWQCKWCGRSGGNVTTARCPPTALHLALVSTVARRSRHPAAATQTGPHPLTQDSLPPLPLLTFISISISLPWHFDCNWLAGLADWLSPPCPLSTCCQLSLWAGLGWAGLGWMGCSHHGHRSLGSQCNIYCTGSHSHQFKKSMPTSIQSCRKSRNGVY